MYCIIRPAPASAACDRLGCPLSKVARSVLPIECYVPAPPGAACAVAPAPVAAFCAPSLKPAGGGGGGEDDDRAHGARPSAPHIDLTTSPAAPAGRGGRRSPAAPARRTSPERRCGGVAPPPEGAGFLKAYVSDSVLPSESKRTKILPSCRITSCTRCLRPLLHTVPLML